MTLSKCSRPSSFLCSPTSSSDLCNKLFKAGKRIWLIKDDFPAPDTPVIQVNKLTGL